MAHSFLRVLCKSEIITFIPPLLGVEPQVNRIGFPFGQWPFDQFEHAFGANAAFANLHYSFSCTSVRSRRHFDLGVNNPWYLFMQQRLKPWNSDPTTFDE